VQITGILRWNPVAASRALAFEVSELFDGTETRIRKQGG
jgi:hypothetical protein